MLAGVVVSDIVQVARESDGKPVPETDTVKVPVAGTRAMEGDRVIEGITKKAIVPLSAPQVTVNVNEAPPGPDGPDPTTKDPYTFPATTWMYLFVMTELPVISQLVPSAAVVTVPSTIITSPSFPFANVDGPVRVSPVMPAACARLGGTATVAIETNSAEVRSSNINREPELRLVNLRHAVMMSRVWRI